MYLWHVSHDNSSPSRANNDPAYRAVGDASTVPFLQSPNRDYQTKARSKAAE